MNNERDFHEAVWNAFLTEGPCTIQHVADHLSFLRQAVQSAVKTLQEQGRLHATGMEGRRIVFSTSKATQIEEFAEKSPVAQPRLVDKMLGHYDGKELRPFTGRPGAMDAYSLPSRTMWGK